MLFWVVWEIWKANSILSRILDPANSTNRGFEEARKSYNSGEFRFKAYGRGVPGLSKRDLEIVYSEYRPYNTWNSVVYGDQGFEQLALKINSYNEYYGAELASGRLIRRVLD